MTKTSISYKKSVRSSLSRTTLFMVLMFFFTPIKAQTYFHKYLEPSYAWNVFQQNDDTYRLIGMTALANSSDSSNIVFIKLDSLGGVVYQKEISSAYADDNYHVKQVGNKFIVDGGSGNALPDTTKRQLAAIDMDGNIIWHGRYGNHKNLATTTNELTSTSDKGIMAVGWGHPDSLFGGYNIYVYKTDSIGNFQWGKVYGTAYDEGPLRVIPTKDGNYLILANYYGSNSPSTFKPLLFKINTNGTIWWAKTYTLTSYPYLYSFTHLLEQNNGDVLLIGASLDSNDVYNPLLVKINPLGTVVISNAVNFNAYIPSFSGNYISTNDTGYAFFTAHTAMFIEGKAYQNSLFKLDKNLNIEWIKRYPNIVTVKDLKQTNDGGFVFVGEGNSYSQTFPGTSLPLTIIKTDKYGNSGCFEQDTMATTYPITVYDSVFTLQSYNEGFQSASSTTTFFSPMQSYTHCFCSVTGGFTFTTNGDTITFTNTTTGASSYTWNFGDGNTSNDFSPTHVYDTSSTYNVSLVVQDGICIDTVYASITIVGVKEYENPLNFSVYPNPSFSNNVQFTTTEQGIYELKITDLTGKLIDNISFTGKQYTYQSKHLSTGLYFYEITDEKKVKSRGKLVKR